MKLKHKVDIPKKDELEFLERELKSQVDAEVRFDNATRMLYTTDGSNYRQIPLGIVIPRTTGAVEQTIALCRKYGVPIFSRGCGTSLAGQCCNIAVTIDFSKYLNRILEIDPGKKLARVEPGTILDHLRDAAEQHTLTFGPDPATHTHNTLGGMLGNDSCGIHSVMSGRTADNVQELEILTYDGLRMRVGPTSEKEMEDIIDQGGRRGAIYSEMRDLINRYAELVRKRYPKIPRRVSGYNLDNLLPEKGFNVARALVGSEGTLVTILSATLNLIYSPPGRSLLVLGYPDVFSAGDHVPQIMGFHPTGCEGIDEMLVDFMKTKGLHPKDVTLLPEGRGWLLVEFGGRDKKESDERAKEVMEELKKTPNPPSMKLFTNESEEKKIWEVRESGLGATANVPGQPLSWPGWEDSAVPPGNVGDYLRELKGLFKDFGYKAALYGHFGQGCIHCRIPFDLFTHDGVQKYLRFVNKAAEIVVSYGGSFSGEHGDGQSRAMLLPKMFGDELVKAFRKFKSIWDPEWKMNPGKVVDPYPIDSNLRLGEGYEPWQPPTEFKFPDDKGSFSRATLRCVGVGKCRRTHDAFMCPSFLATREEMHTTRGRAHALFEMFRGDFIRGGWQSREVKEALEFCLGCKGCKLECPVNVDIATYKAEFLDHYYKWKLRPRAAYAMGLIEYWAAIGEKMPGLANFFSQTPGLNNILKEIAGFAQERNIPKLAGKTFTSSFVPSKEKGKEKVILYPDLFNDCFFPETLQAAADVLARWGFHVRLPDKRPPAVRPLIHFGMALRAKKALKKCLKLLRPFMEEGVPVIFCEPSTASVYKDELLQLFPNDRDAQRIAKLSYLLSDFIEDRKLPLPALDGDAVFHAHCHQKAVLNPQAARNILSGMGLKYIEPQPGCCGMAGAFGMEKDKYEISMKIGNEHLLPTVQEADRSTFIVADGFSCRSQIMDGTGRKPFHISELIQYAFRIQGEKPDFQKKKQMQPEGKGHKGKKEESRKEILVQDKKEEKMEVKTMASKKSEVVVVTGGTAGLGRAIVRMFAMDGAKIGVLARGKDRLEETRREVEKMGGHALAISTDVAHPDEVERAADEIEAAFGPIDIWINNAMTSVFAPFKEMTPADFQRVTEVTYLGQVYGTMAALKRMIPRDHGTIIQVGSALAIRSIPLQSAYCGAKHGVRGFTDSIRSELLHDGSNVHITMVQLPAMNTPQFEWVKSKLKHKAQPVPPIYQPEIGAKAVYYAVRHHRREIEVGLPTVEAIVGQKLVPGLLDEYLAKTDYQAQQTDEPEDPNRRDNLYEPVPGNFAAHGRFDKKSKSSSKELWYSLHKKSIGWGLAAAAALAGTAILQFHKNKDGSR